MQLAFYGNRWGGFGNKLIRWWTSSMKDKFNGKWKDSFSHVELLFSDGMMFSASQYENNTRFKKHSYTGHAWIRVPIKMSKEEEKKIREYCESVDGAEYDYLGVLGFLLPFSAGLKSKWFCSEVCTMGLQQVGMCNKLDSSKTSPNDLYREIQNGKAT